MQCKQVEQRLNVLLDRRRHWSNDPALATHCARCPSCRQLAEAYAIVDSALVSDTCEFEISPEFASRVLAEIRSEMRSVRSSRLSSAPVGFTTILMRIAAVLLVTAAPLTVWMMSGTSSIRSPRIAGGQALYQLPQQLPDGLVMLLHDEPNLTKDLWRNTGRGIAVLPQQVRRAAALSESVPITGAIRPVAGAWQAFWRVLPSESMRTQPGSRETGFLLALPAGFTA